MTTEPATYTTAETAALLGCHPDTLLQLVRAGKLPAIQFGTRVRFSRAAVSRWLEQGHLPGDEPKPRLHAVVRQRLVAK